MSRAHRKLHRLATPNLAPMVDVVMVILIFFMLGTSFAPPEGAMAMKLPNEVGPGGGATVDLLPEVRVTLRAAEGGRAVRIEVMGARLADGSFDGLAAHLRAKRVAGADPRSRVVMAAEPDLKYRFVIAAFDACVRGGFSNVQFSLSRPGSAGEGARR